jgi:WD40 repeat protein
LETFMVGQSAGRNFISYSRKDGKEFAGWLRGWLGERDLSVWQDIVALEGGRDWWSQIEEALKSKGLQHFILVITPAALESPYVRREIRLARQEGKTVCPVKGPGLTDLDQLPRWLGQVYDLDRTEHQTTLIRVLQDVSRQKRVPMMAPEPPEDFVPRPKEFDALKAQLLNAKGDAVAAITAALKGAGGYGKTTLAKALAHDPDIQDAYFDGILWAEIGEKPERLLSILTDQIEVLTGERPGLETINAAAGKVGEALGDRRILMVVDDAWREQDLKPFLQGGRNCTRLVTTRIDNVLPQTAVRQPVDAMQASEALELLSAGLPAYQVAGERANLKKLAARLGEWAQLLKIVNGFLRDRVVRARQPLSAALVGANKGLDAKGLVAFDPRDDSDRTKTIARTIEISLDLLSEAERARFGELAVFPEDAEIPASIVARLWTATGGLPDFETEAVLSRLFDLSLLLDLDLGQVFFRLHDTTRHFLRDRAGKDGLVAQHKQLVAALDGVASEGADARTRRYYYLNLPHHLAEAQGRARLDALLLDPAWLQAKLEATANPQALVADYERYGVGEAQSLIGRTLRLISGICARDARQLPQQLIWRLAGFEAVAGSGFIDRARRLLPRPSLVLLRPTLTPPGAETARLEGHTGPVYTLCLLADGRLASGSEDGTIRLWDAATGAETACLKGHTGWVTALCLLADGRLASGSTDRTIRLWDVATGAETARLEGHSVVVTALCLLADGRLASGSDNGTIRLWDVATGAETARLEGHTGPVYTLCLLADRRLASGSWDRTIRLWDVATGGETARLDGHDGWVTALCLLADGRLASGSDNGTIRLWDAATGAETARLEGHSDSVTALCFLADGRLASGSSDTTIRLWDVSTGAETARLEGHTNSVVALCQLADGWLASGSWDNTVRLWDAATGAETARLEGHSDSVTALCFLADGRLASGSWDETVRLWDVSTEAETARLELDAPVQPLVAIAPNRLVAGDRRGLLHWLEVLD